MLRAKLHPQPNIFRKPFISSRVADGGENRPGGVILRMGEKITHRGLNFNPRCG
jgi:hypothetical protein